MNQIITIGRQFGSGGRELGRRVAETLGIAYYDREIVEEIAKRTELSEDYVRRVVEKSPLPLYPITIGRSFSITPDPMLEMNLSIYRQQESILRELAEKSSCVIVGRCADHILREQNPLRVFVYAELEERVLRCREREESVSELTDRKLRKQVQSVDRGRADYYAMYTGKTWGQMDNYDLCLNTTKKDLKLLAQWVAAFAHVSQKASD